MTRLERKLKARLERGGKLPIAYDLYNQNDVNELSTTIAANGYTTWSRIGFLLIFEVTEDESDR